MGFKGLLPPADNARKAAVAEGIDILGVNSLPNATGFLIDRMPVTFTTLDLETDIGPLGECPADFREVKGQWKSRPQAA